MTLQQLRYIVTLDQERHFARAAKVCMVSQPGLSIQLKNLEEEIGIKIFDRTKVPLKPTDAGVEIIHKAGKILREADSIRDYVVKQKNVLEGEVDIGVVSTLSPYLIPLVINAIQEKVPKMKFKFKEASTTELISELESGLIDIALMATPIGKSGLKEFPVFNEPFIAYLSEQHPLANETEYELQPNDKAKLLLIKDEYCYNAQLLDICSIKTDEKMDNFAFDINSIETLKNMVRAGLGFAIVPELSILNELDKTLFKPFKDPKPVREVSLVVSDTFSKKLLLEKINEAIWEALPDSFKQKFNFRKIRWNDSPYFVKAYNGKM